MGKTGTMQVKIKINEIMLLVSRTTDFTNGFFESKLWQS